MKEIIKPIPGYNDYYASNLGNIFSKKSGQMKLLHPQIDTKGLYLLLSLTRNDGVRKHLLVHRIIAKTFISNPKNLPEVNHKDKNTQNNCINNLEWCTRKKNLEDSYSTMSPTRNFNRCILYKNEKPINSFQSIKEACRYAKKHYHASESSLEKYLEWNDMKIVDTWNKRKVKATGTTKKTQQKGPILLLQNNKIIFKCKTFIELERYFYKNHVTYNNRILKEKTLNYYFNKKVIFNNYQIKRAI